MLVFGALGVEEGKAPRAVPEPASGEERVESPGGQKPAR
jgi:hypothetical protein